MSVVISGRSWRSRFHTYGLSESPPSMPQLTQTESDKSKLNTKELDFFKKDDSNETFEASLLLYNPGSKNIVKEIENHVENVNAIACLKNEDESDAKPSKGNRHIRTCVSESNLTEENMTAIAINANVPVTIDPLNLKEKKGDIPRDLDEIATESETNGNLREELGFLKSRYKSFWKELTSFANVTTIHGCLAIRLAPSIAAKAIWLSLALSVATIVVFGLTEKTKLFFSFPSEDAFYSREEQVTFPSVTVCAIEPVKMSSKHKYIAELDKNTLHLTWQFQNTKEVIMLHPLSFDPWYDTSNLFSRLDYTRKRTLFSKTRYAENLQDNGTEMLFRTFDDIILECRFNGEICDKHFFKKVFIPLYGNCFTFDTNETERYAVKETGPESGLIMTLFTDSYNPIDYNTYVFQNDHRKGQNSFTAAYATGSDGIRLAIHAPGTLPQPEDKGIDLSPGRFTAIGLSQDVRTLMEPPYGNCTNEFLNNYTRHMTYRYTADLCYQRCLQKSTMATCGCVTPRAPIYSEVGNLKPVPYCGIYLNPDGTMLYKWVIYGPQSHLNLYEWNKTIYAVECEKKVSENIRSSKDTSCGCKKQCKEIIYDPLISTTPWPHKKYYQSINGRSFIRFIKRFPNIKSLFKLRLDNSDGRYDPYDDFCYFYTILHIKWPEWYLYIYLFPKSILVTLEDGVYLDDSDPYIKCNFYHRYYNKTAIPTLYFPELQNVTFNKYAIANKIIEKNFLKVNIFYRSLNVNRIAEESSYPLHKWLSEIGGIVGMYLGMSVFSMVELVYITITLLVALVCNCKCKKKERS